jgi:hypothetical protein
LPTRTGRDPAQPATPSTCRSSGDVAAAHVEHRCREHVAVSPSGVHELEVAPGIARLADQRSDRSRQRSVTQPGEAVVELPVVPGRLGQAPGGRGDDGAGGRRGARSQDRDGVQRAFGVAAGRLAVLQAVPLGRIPLDELLGKRTRVVFGLRADGDDQACPHSVGDLHAAAQQLAVDIGPTPEDLQGHLAVVPGHGRPGHVTLDGPGRVRGVKPAESQLVFDNATQGSRSGRAAA